MMAAGPIVIDCDDALRPLFGKIDDAHENRHVQGVPPKNEIMRQKFHSHQNGQNSSEL